MATRFPALLVAVIVVATVAVVWAVSAVTIEAPHGGLTIVTRFY